MHEEMVKVCPDCGSEFQMRMERCLDCGANLVVDIPRPEPRFEARGTFKAPEEPAIPPGCVLVRTAAVGWIRRLSEDLDDAGIRHWTTPPVWRQDPSLYVLPSDQEAALRIDRARYEIEVPGVAAEDALPRFQTRQRDLAEDANVKICPRCGAEYQLWVLTCVDCGAALVHPWDLESARNAETVRAAEPVAFEDSGACPACGERLRGGETECPGCGLTLAQPDACPNCGVELEPHVAECRRCGQKLFESPEP